MIAATENALVGALRDAGEAGTLGYRYDTLDSYPDDFDAYLKDKTRLRTPAAWAVFLGLAEGEDSADGSGWQGRARFALVVASRSLRNETSTRHGGADPAKEPGSYQLAIDAVRLLTGQTFGFLVKPIKIAGMRLVARTGELRTQGLSLMAIEIGCTVAAGQFVDPDATGEFEIFHADWDVPAFGNVALNTETPFLPAGRPDAEDLVELPQ